MLKRYRIAGLDRPCVVIGLKWPGPGSMPGQHGMHETYGKCKERVDELVASDETLVAVRGWYHCFAWGRREHWWAKAPDGTIVDPTADQFPSKGMGDYEEYRGVVTCEDCGKEVAEEVANFVGHHVYCSDICYGWDVGYGTLF